MNNVLGNDSGNFVLSPLGFSNDYLEPYISEDTIRHHYYGHLGNYIKSLNQLKFGISRLTNSSLCDIISSSSGSLHQISSQVWNHYFYFDQFSELNDSKRSLNPGSKLGSLIIRDFGSLSDFCKKFKESSLTVFGSGWSWLVYDGSNLVIKVTSGAEIPEGSILMTLDLWEHAYYLDYPNDRSGYIDSFFKILDWSTIDRRINEIKF